MKDLAIGSRRISPGYRGKIRADEFNRWQIAADQVNNQHNITRPFNEGPSPNWVVVKNDTASTCNRFNILGVAGFIIDPDDNLGQFQNQIGLLGVLPIGRGFETGAEIHTEDSFVVLVEPIKAGKMGYAWASGTCPVQVLVKNTAHRYAKIIDNDATKLETADSGPVVLLWKDDGAVDTIVWAVIRWGGSGGATGRYRVKNVYPEYLECKSWDGTTEGSVFVNIAKPWLLRGTLTSYDGKTISTPSSDGQQVLATEGSTVETWEITLRWITNAEIVVAAAPAGGTGVSVSGSPLQLYDTNDSGRHWAKLNSTPPALGQGQAAGDVDFPYWIQGYGFLENSGAQITVAAVVQDCAVLENAGAAIACSGITSSLGAPTLTSAGAIMVASGSGASISAPGLSGAGGAFTATVIVSAVGSGALSGPNALMQGYAA